jgi:serine O-acetyltransferase
VELTADEELRYGAGKTRMSRFKAMLVNPGYLVVRLHFAASRQRKKGRNLVADLLWRFNVLTSSCHIHYDATIGRGLFLPHPSGIVIGSGAILKDNVTIYQGVTLGRQSATSAYPTIESDVTIFPNATIVGGVTVGAGAIIGANSFVNTDVAPGDCVAGAPARSIRRLPATP